MTTTGDFGRAAPAGDHGRRRIVWTRGRRVTFGIIGFGSLLIALTGFVGSYTAVRDLAVEKGFGWFALIFPLGIDIGIIVMLSLDLALTWVDLRYPLLRHIAWLLTIATVAFNAMAAYPDILASVMHATIPLLFIAITEAVRHAVATATARDAGREDYALSLGRWLLAPWSTWLIWRSRKLWPSTIPSYEVALELFQRKLEYRQELRDEYGWRWRRKARRDELRPLRRSRLGYAVRPAAEPVPASGRPTTSEVVPEEACLPARLAGRALEAAVEHGPARSAESPADRSRSQVPEGAAAAVIGPEWETALDHPGEDPPAQDTAASAQAEDPADDLDTGDAGAVDDDKEDDAEEDPEDGDADVDADKKGEVDEVDDSQADPLPEIPLGTAPDNESKRQRAERIYLAHQDAGVELTRANLTRWAGYQKAGSGRTAYVELERKYGPIVVRDEGADYSVREELTPAHS
ncbi:DUF2637 domain-containing protein [Streptomyces sp. NBC_01433]|uniref:DUF2637 domain-containing protein n=1 Tax=Streptomyces sp. NBC_01433 TaxID=2903864 RepID=UPI00224F662E|nr:DUF2637 domain-containing protein [Streptomyces sp. NBC_01433]MCX4682221.1 DUF2637 domain-containing protein [Streptomyces sp. NBC_01433]